LALFTDLYSVGKRKTYLKLAGETEYTQVPGIISDDISPGEAETTSVDFQEGKIQRTGSPDPPAITLELMMNYWHPTSVDIRKAYRERTQRDFRTVTEGELLFTAPSGTTVAIAVTGVCTFAGDGAPDFASNNYGPGQVIGVGGTNYTIRSIVKAGSAYTVTVDELGTDNALSKPGVVNAAAFTIFRPTKQQDYTARVRNAGSEDAPAGGDVRTQILLAPPSVLSESTLIPVTA